MRRAVVALALTFTGLWFTLTYKTIPLAHGAGSGPFSGPGVGIFARPGTRVVQGDIVQNAYGYVQVAVIVRAGRIVDVAALQLPLDAARSYSINTQAEPLLRAEALRSQSARIDTVGGATATSAGYAQSLQSALDRARQ
jgi:hypothetical protein